MERITLTDSGFHYFTVQLGRYRNVGFVVQGNGYEARSYRTRFPDGTVIDPFHSEGHETPEAAARALADNFRGKVQIPDRAP